MFNSSEKARCTANSVADHGVDAANPSEFAAGQAGKPTAHRAFWKGCLLALSIGALIVLGIWRQSSQSDSGRQVSETGFSSERAYRYLEQIAREPHPTGSSQLAEVRQRIVKYLTELGVEPQIQESRGGVRNIVARLRGTNNSKSIMLMCHYDSVPSSPGAGDNGSGVVALLETLRALIARGPLMNDVIFLFTDGEEAGLLGAKAFLFNHPWGKDLGLVINFDSRGNKGPAVMYETSPNNQWLIAQFARAAIRPTSSSLMSDVYKLLPHDTDFTVFNDAGLPGFNFALIEGGLHYHDSSDTFDRVAPGSLRLLTENALALTSHFGGLQLNRDDHGAAVYFDVLGVTLLYYPSTAILPIVILAAALTVTLATLTARRGALTAGGLLRGLLWGGGGLLAAVLSVYVINRMSVRGAGYNLRSEGGAPDLFKCVIPSIIVLIAFYVYERRNIRIAEAMMGSLIWWLLLALLTGVWLPGASFLPAWPMLATVCGLLPLYTQWGRKLPASVKHALPLFGAFLSIILFTPTIRLMLIGLASALPIIPAALVALLLMLLLPLVELAVRTDRSPRYRDNQRGLVYNRPSR
jgi:hypothetical protein